MTRLRLVHLACALLAAGCFAPKLPECAFRCGTGGGTVCPPDNLCGTDGFCHKPGELPSCKATSSEAGVADASIVIDGPITIDGPAVTIDAHLGDAPVVTIDAPPADARPPDARPPDARPPDAMVTIDAPPPPDAPAIATPDASLCSAATCGDPRACGVLDHCDCGDTCDFDAEWCGQNCVFAVCEANDCCLPESSPCDIGLGQCCAGLICALLVCITQ